MGVHVIKMPDIGEGIAEVELVAWHVKVGDRVAEDQALADVMTDKANVEIPSPVVGTVLELGGQVGDTMAVGSMLIRIEVAGEGTARKSSPAQAKTEAKAAQPAEPAAPSAPKAVMPASAPVSVAFTPAAAAALASKAVGIEAPSRTEAEGEPPIASPAVRRRAWEAGVDLAGVRGTGAGGRIMQADLDAAAAASGIPSPPAASFAPKATVAQQRSGEISIPVIGVRRKIAQKMQESKRRIPHFSYVEEIDVTEVEGLRAALNAKWSAQRGKLTLLPFIARAIVLSVREFPQINARFDDEAGVVTRYAAVHMGIATQTDSGLMVPVMRNAEALDLWGTSAEVARLADAARSGKVTRGELTGSTITLTSLGALGGIATTPVINHPEVAIVGVNRMVERPTYRNGAIVPRLLMNLSSSFDHRVVDGMDAARFVQAMRAMLESPAMLFIE